MNFKRISIVKAFCQFPVNLTTNVSCQLIFPALSRCQLLFIICQFSVSPIQTLIQACCNATYHFCFGLSQDQFIKPGLERIRSRFSQFYVKIHHGVFTSFYVTFRMLFLVCLRSFITIELKQIWGPKFTKFSKKHRARQKRLPFCKQ